MQLIDGSDRVDPHGKDEEQSDAEIYNIIYIYIYISLMHCVWVHKRGMFDLDWDMFGCGESKPLCPPNVVGSTVRCEYT